MKEFVEFLAKSLVEHPDQVVVTEREAEQETVYEIQVAEEDMGRIIGKQGRVAKSLRTLAKAAAVKHGTRVHVAIVDQ